MSSSRGPWVLLGALGIAAVLASYAGKKSTPPSLSPTAPRESDYDTSDEKLLVRNAMLQMSREMLAAGWTDASRVYAEQADAAPPGTASRALEHIADELDKLGMRNGAKLRDLARKIYTPPAQGAS